MGSTDHPGVKQENKALREDKSRDAKTNSAVLTKSHLGGFPFQKKKKKEKTLAVPLTKLIAPKEAAIGQ